MSEEQTITTVSSGFRNDGWQVGHTLRIESSKKNVQFWAQNRRTSKYAAKRWAYLVRHGLAYTVSKITSITEGTLTVEK